MDTTLFANVIASSIETSTPFSKGGKADLNLNVLSDVFDASASKDADSAWASVFSDVLTSMQLQGTEASESDRLEDTQVAVVSDSVLHVSALDHGRVGVHALQQPSVSPQASSQALAIHRLDHGRPAQPIALPGLNQAVVPAAEQALQAPVPAAESPVAQQGQNLLLNLLEQGRVSGDVTAFSIRAVAGSQADSSAAGNTTADRDLSLFSLSASADPVSPMAGADTDATAGGGTEGGSGFAGWGTEGPIPGESVSLVAGAGGFVSTLAALESRDLSGTAASMATTDMAWVEQIQQQVLEARRLGEENSLMLDVMLAGEQRLSLQAQLQDGVLKLSVEAGSVLANLLGGEQGESLKSSLLEGAPDIREIQLEVTAEDSPDAQQRFTQSDRDRGGDRAREQTAEVPETGGIAVVGVSSGTDASVESSRLSWRA